MCLSAAYTVRKDSEELICKFVSQISVKDGVVTLTDVMGEVRQIPGELYDVDLIKNTVKIRVEA